MGDYIPAKLGFADGEFVVQMIATADYQGDLLFVFANGKAARVPMSAYATKTNRKKLQKAYSDRSPLVQILQIPSGEESCSVFFRTDGNRAVLADTALISAKSTRDTQGVQVVTLKAKHLVCEARVLNEEECIALKKYTCKNHSGNWWHGERSAGKRTTFASVNIVKRIKTKSHSKIGVAFVVINICRGLLFRQRVDDMHQEPQQANCIIAIRLSISVAVSIALCLYIQFYLTSSCLVQKYRISNIHSAIQRNIAIQNCGRVYLFRRSCSRGSFCCSRGCFFRGHSSDVAALC